ncbi:MAG: hypothetical protein ABEI57_06400 [Halapricum sp.]
MGDESTPPADVFDLVGNEIRADVIETLQDAYRDGDRSLSYATLQSRVGIRDSGRFNYHLQRLVGRFVAKNGSDYALTYAGRKVASAIAAGTYNARTTVAPEPVDGTCYACGESSLTVSYSGEQFRITCEACGEEVVHMPFPPGAVEGRDATELQRAFDRWARAWNALAAAGVCPECGGPATATLARDAGELTIGNVDVRAVVDCTRCWMRGYLPVGCLLLEHPAVAAFYWRHGRDVRAAGIWEHEWALAESFQTVVDDDPYVLELAVPLDAAELRVTVDDSLRVLDTVERRDCDEG